MKSRVASLGAAVLVASIALPGGALGQKPPKPPKPPKPYEIPGPVSISAAPNPTVFSTPVAVSGRVQNAGRGIRVTLQARIVPATTFTTVGTTTTANNGGYRINHRPPRNTTYRVLAATAPPKQSGDLLVPVRTLIGFRVSDSTPEAGSRVRFSGIVRPPHNGRRAYLQKQASGGRFVTVARMTLRRLDAQSSRYSVRRRVRRTGAYRVRVLGHSDHAMGISRTRIVTVR